MDKSLKLEDFIDDAARIGCDVAAIRAVASVESSGTGFDPEGFPKTLFEGHWFDRYTKGIYRTDNPDLSYPKWTKQFYGKTWQQEKLRLDRASSLDRNAAFMSTSWGMFQIMGFNFGLVGYSSIQDFVNAMCKDENAQLEAFTNFVLNRGLDRALRNYDWDSFAYGYNGSRYKENNYAVKMANAYKKYS